MSGSSILWQPAPYHILAYGSLLGTELFQSFIGGVVAYQALPRPQFATLQSKLFPIYFSMQTALPAVLALTYPGVLGSASGISGVFGENNRWTVLAPLATILVSSAANLLVIGPATTNCMKERKHQETRDGKKSYDPAPHSKEMQELNAKFGKLHGISTLFNLGGFLATIAYGFTIASRIV